VASRALAPPWPAELALHRVGPGKESRKVEEADAVGHFIFRLGETREIGRWWVVISPTGNTWPSYHAVQLTKHEHRKPDYPCASYQTLAVCIGLAWSRLTWLRVSLARS
jgi:hypothetical protein